MRIILIAEHASIDFGGEAALPCHYFRVLLNRNIDVHLVIHERSKPFLSEHFPNSSDRIHYVEDSRFHRFLYRCSQLPPVKLNSMVFGFLLALLTQAYQKKIASKLIEDSSKTIVHQVIPVSPKAPSTIFGLGVPVLFGPLNGGMEYPKGFSQYHSSLSRYLDNIGRNIANVVTYFLRGKLEADVILVANSRSHQALPSGVKAKVVELVENGVDLSIWKNRLPQQTSVENAVPTFVYVGRLVSWKAVDILVEAFFSAANEYGEMKLHIIGDGDQRTMLENICEQHSDKPGTVIFEGWKKQSEISGFLQQADALLLPSLYECGGAVVLEAMASSVAVVATEWGGPADYIDESCGLLVKPTSRQDMVESFRDNILRLAKQPDQAKKMGKNGRKKIEQEYDWEKKVDKVVEIYQELL